MANNSGKFFKGKKVWEVPCEIAMTCAIQNELKIPVKFIGVGEQLDDLEKFDPEDFVDALFNRE